MKTGEMPSVTSNLNVGAENKKVIMVDSDEVMTQSNSRSRGGRMDLKDGYVNLMPGSSKDSSE